MLNSVNVANVKKVPKLIDDEVQVEDLAQIKESHHHADHIWRTLGTNAFHEEDYLREEAWHGKNESQHEVVTMKLYGSLPSLSSLIA